MDDSAQNIIKSLLKFNLDDFSVGFNENDSCGYTSNLFSESVSYDSSVSMMLPPSFDQLHGGDLIQTVRSVL
jgi:hypothetical protein